MQFSIQNSIFKSALVHAQMMTTKQSGLPVLGYVFITTQENSVCVRSTNLSLGIEEVIPGKIEEQGSCVISAQVLIDTLGTLSPQSVLTFIHKDSVCIVRTESTESTIKTITAEDFPSLPLIADGSLSMTCTASDLIHAFKSVMYAASHSDIKPEISSLYFYTEGNDCVFVSTDSFRLAEKKIPCMNVKTDIPGSMIPIKNVQILHRILQDIDTTVDIFVTQSQIVFTTPTLYLVSRLVDGNYPDYRQIIPTETTTEITVLRQDFIHALQTVTLFSDKFTQMDMTIDSQTKTCTCFSEQADVGRAQAVIQVQTTGESITLRYNARYLLDCLQVISSDSVTLECTTPQRPMIIRPTGEYDFMYLIMPLHRSS